jgi:5-methylcytosine-specific restriction endonuclease McrA
VKSTRGRSLSPDARKVIRAKTGGRCHVCGGLLGPKWAADHVRPRARGGRDAAENYLPACSICNGARWHRKSKVIRRMLRLGAYLLPEIEARTTLGKNVRKHYLKRRQQNRTRRKG